MGFNNKSLEHELKEMLFCYFDLVCMDQDSRFGKQTKVWYCLITLQFCEIAGKMGHIRINRPWGSNNKQG